MIWGWWLTVGGVLLILTEAPGERARTAAKMLLVPAWPLLAAVWLARFWPRRTPVASGLDVGGQGVKGGATR